MHQPIAVTDEEGVRFIDGEVEHRLVGVRHYGDLLHHAVVAIELFAACRRGLVFINHPALAVTGRRYEFELLPYLPAIVSPARSNLSRNDQSR
ncbi:MAG: hypothetical protein OHK0046_46240 [Anaerolineae bacterium]